MADYKNLTAEEVRATLETVDYDTLTTENLWDMRQSLETEKNNFAENEKNPHITFWQLWLKKDSRLYLLKIWEKCLLMSLTALKA